MDIDKELKSLSELKDGWYDGEGFAPTQESLDSVRTILKFISDAKLPEPAVFPSPDGQVGLEWHTDTCAISIMMGGTVVTLFSSNSKLEVLADKWFVVDCDNCCNTLIEKLQYLFNL